MLYPKIQGREEEILQTLRTWKALGGKLYVLGETWHCAAIWLQLKSGCGCHPVGWYFCFKDLLAAKEILLAIKRPVFFASFLHAWFPFHHLLFCQVSLWQKGCVCVKECSWGTLLRSVTTTAPQRASQTPCCSCSTWYCSQCVFLPSNHLLGRSRKQKVHQKFRESILSWKISDLGP